MHKRNIDIRERMKENKIPFWLIAEKLEVHENTVYRLLRQELNESQKYKLHLIIDQLTNEHV
jgi:IS30 family transposase